jgi:beta-1,4-mannosyl-glycoprotein beta-1,4-N-acetylglucosaminyltransferase
MRIFDAFPFDGELDLLAYRLQETADLVDAFVLVEAGQTYRGTSKPLAFEENRARFGWALNKIRHVKLPALGSASSTPRERAAVQRNAAILAIGDADPEDIVLLLDVDEVPSRSFLTRLRQEGLDRPRRLQMTRHYGFADLLGPRSSCCPPLEQPFPAALGWPRPSGWDNLEPFWHGHSGAAVPFWALRASSAMELRFGLPLGDPIQAAGRHFSSVDPSARLHRKLRRVFHAEWDGERETCEAHLDRCRANGVHHRGWWYAERPAGPIPDDVERLLRLHPTLAFGRSPPPRLKRLLVRTWAWVRLWKALPNEAVRLVDRHFERMAPLLALPLLACEIGRRAAARLRSGSAGADPQPGHHH